MPHHIHIVGASGSGTTTLGRALAARLSVPHFDSDDFLWLPSDPPFQNLRPMPERQDKLALALDGAGNGWVLSGALTRWGDPFIARFDLVVFLTLRADVRLARLKQREVERYGADAIVLGGALHKMHTEFLTWAARYEEGGLDVRSRALHEAWLACLACPVLRLDSRESVEALVAAVLRGPLSAPCAG